MNFDIVVWLLSLSFVLINVAGIQEAERLAYDNFTRKGYSNHALRTKTGGPLNETCMQRIRREVHLAHQQKRKVGALRIKAIKVDHKTDDKGELFPPADEEMLCRDSLYQAIAKSTKSAAVVASRQSVIDEITHCQGPNLAEVNKILAWGLRLNANNHKQACDILAIADWASAESVEDKFEESWNVFKEKLGDALKTMRSKTRKSTPCAKAWAKKHLKRLALIVDPLAITDICNCAPGDEGSVSEQLLLATSVPIGMVLFGKELSGILVQRVRATIVKHVDVYAEQKNWTQATMDTAIQQCRAEIMKMKGLEKLPAQRKNDLQYGGRSYKVLSTTTQFIEWCFHMRFRELLVANNVGTALLNEKELWLPSRLSALQDETNAQRSAGKPATEPLSISTPMTSRNRNYMLNLCLIALTALTAHAAHPVSSAEVAFLMI